MVITTLNIKFTAIEVCTLVTTLFRHVKSLC